MIRCTCSHAGMEKYKIVYMQPSLPCLHAAILNAADVNTKYI